MSVSVYVIDNGSNVFKSVCACYVMHISSIRTRRVAVLGVCSTCVHLYVCKRGCVCVCVCVCVCERERERERERGHTASISAVGRPSPNRRVPTWRIGERPPDMRVSCNISRACPDE